MSGKVMVLLERHQYLEVEVDADALEDDAASIAGWASDMGHRWEDGPAKIIWMKTTEEAEL